MFRIARTLDEVMDAWRLVYQVYCEASLIADNPWQIHAAPHAVGHNTAVITRWRNGTLQGTMTAFLENGGELPLDQIFHDRLEEIRRCGRRIAEVGLFAETTSGLGTSVSDLFEMMSMAIHFAWHVGADDIVIGVHPRHEGFYRRYFGFECVGDVRAYPRVRNHPAVLLRLDRHAVGRRGPIPRGLSFHLDRDMTLDVFDRRCRFEDDEVSNSLLCLFLREIYSARIRAELFRSVHRQDDVRQADDTHQPALAVHDQQPADRAVSHQSDGRLQVVVA